MWGAEAGLDQGLACLAGDHGLDVSLGKGVDVAHLTGIRNSVWVPVSVDIHKPGRETDRRVTVVLSVINRFNILKL